MKQYFAKYLPIEGEIKMEEIKYLLLVSVPDAYGRGFIANHKHTEDNIMVIFNMEEEGYYKLSELKKLKLFLCSRDIQVGDNFKFRLGINKDYPWIDGICEQITESLITLPDNGNGKLSINRKNNFDYFKIIGEISPEATWVKEGDEFNKENIKFSFGKREDKGYTHLEDVRKPIYKIKGPCGHFH